MVKTSCCREESELSKGTAVASVPPPASGSFTVTLRHDRTSEVRLLWIVIAWPSVARIKNQSSIADTTMAERRAHVRGCEVTVDVNEPRTQKTNVIVKPI